MRTIPTWSLRRRLLVLLLVPLLLVCLLLLLDAYRGARGMADAAYDRLIAASARAIADRIGIVAGEVDVDLPYVAFEILASNVQDRVFYRIQAPDDSLVTGYPDLPLPPRTVTGGGPLFYDALYRGEAVRAVALTRRVAGFGRTGEVLVLVAQTRSERNLLAARLAQGTAGRLLVVVLLVAGLTWLGVRLGLAPLNRLQKEIRRRSPQDVRPLESDVPREVRDLVGAIDHLMGRLAGTLRVMQDFISDAAHQLRTPLAALQAQAELAQRESRPEARQAAISRIREATARTTRMVNQLLAHARSTPGNAHHQPLDLVPLAAELCREFVPAALTRNIDLGYEGESEPVMVVGDALLLRELLSNLLDNALRYSPDGARVTVRLWAGEAGPCLEVEDSGPGIPVAERERVFERFYRVPGSGAEGSGLGLAIVGMIAEGHGGRVELGEGEIGGLRVTICFPPPPKP